MYRSLAEVQIEREEDIARHPVSRPEGPVPQTPAELLYQVRNPEGDTEEFAKPPVDSN